MTKSWVATETFDRTGKKKCQFYKVTKNNTKSGNKYEKVTKKEFWAGYKSTIEKIRAEAPERREGVAKRRGNLLEIEARKMKVAKEPKYSRNVMV